MISGHLTIIFSHFIEGYLIPFARYITGENVPCLSPQNLVFFKQRFSFTNFKGEKVRVWLANSFQYYPVSRGYIFAVWAVMRKVAGYFSHDSSHSENVASARRVFQYWHRTIFFNLLLFKETPNLIPNSFAVFKYFPRYLVCLGKFNTLLNFRRPGVSYTFNSFNKLISFIYSSSSSDTYILCTLPDNLLTVGHTRKYGYGKSLKLITYHKSLTSIPPHHAH